MSSTNVTEAGSTRLSSTPRAAPVRVGGSSSSTTCRSINGRSAVGWRISALKASEAKALPKMMAVETGTAACEDSPPRRISTGT
eukprot:scaffold101833_cov72-Phaeocystis_antarctica.AAC.4